MKSSIPTKENAGEYWWCWDRFNGYYPVRIDYDPYHKRVESYITGWECPDIIEEQIKSGVVYLGRIKEPIMD